MNTATTKKTDAERQAEIVAALIDQQTAIASAAAFYAAALEAAVDGVDPETATWATVGQFAHVSDLAKSLMDTVKECSYNFASI